MAVRYYGKQVIAAIKSVIGSTVTDPDTGANISIPTRMEAEPFVYLSAAGATFPAIIIETREDFPAILYDDGDSQHLTQVYRMTVHYAENPSNATNESAFAQARRRAEVIAGKVAAAPNLNLTEPLTVHSDGSVDFVQYTQVSRVGKSVVQDFLREAGQGNKVVRSFDVEVEVWCRRPKSSE